jgi:hypothetical protein
VIADPAMNTIQVFDLTKGTYLYAFGGETGKPDPKNSEIAQTDWAFPAYPYIFPSGERLAVYNPFEKIWYVRQILDEGRTLRQQYIDEAINPAEPAAAQ